jgi:hypothetical protein
MSELFWLLSLAAGGNIETHCPACGGPDFEVVNGYIVCNYCDYDERPKGELPLIDEVRFRLPYKVNPQRPKLDTGGHFNDLDEWDYA